MEIFMQWMMGAIGFVAFTLLIYIMAIKRNRRPWLWLLIGFLISGLGAVALLLALGKAKD